MTKAISVTDALPGTRCEGPRYSLPSCPDPARWVIHVGDHVYPVCDGHLAAFKRDITTGPAG